MNETKFRKKLVGLIVVIAIIFAASTYILVEMMQAQVEASELAAQVTVLERTAEQLRTQTTQLEVKFHESLESQTPLKQKVAFLTFDDGPSELTDEILDILQAYNVKATFFVTGAMVETYPQQMRRMIADGHKLASHTYSHQYDDIYASLANFQMDFAQMDTLLLEYTGEPTKLFRHPGGSSTTLGNYGVVNETRHWLSTIGVNYTDWNVDSMDASGHDVPSWLIVDETLEQASWQDNYAVILLHDTEYKRATVEALPAIIEGLLAQGFILEAMPDGMDIPQHRLPE